MWSELKQREADGLEWAIVARTALEKREAGGGGVGLVGAKGGGEALQCGRLSMCGGCRTGTTGRGSPRNADYCCPRGSRHWLFEQAMPRQVGLRDAMCQARCGCRMSKVDMAPGFMEFAVQEPR